MKRAKQRRNPSIRYKFVAWDGTLHSAPRSPLDPSVARLQEMARAMAKKYPAISRWVTFDDAKYKGYRPVFTGGDVIPFNPAWLKP